MVNLEDEKSNNDTNDQPTLAPNFFDTSDWSINDLSTFKEVGKGKDTIIYSAQCHRLGNLTVAVKVYNRSKVQGNKLRAIKREIAMMKFFGRQKIPSVVEFYGAFQDETHIYIVMEYCSGGDLLERLLRDKRALSERRTAVEVAAPLLSVLHLLHSNGIIHRDIKLENIFIDSNGRIKLGDFGLTMSSRQESAISPVGTVEYMAPEVVALPPVDMVSSGRVSANSIKPTNEKVDIWALGVTLFELVTGRLPFEGRDKAEVKANITAYKLTAFPNFISPQCQDMIRLMLAYYPSERPSAKELLAHPYLTHYIAATPATKKGGLAANSGSCIAMEVRAGVSSPVSPGPPIGMLQPLAVSNTSTPYLQNIAAGSTVNSQISQNSQLDTSTAYNAVDGGSNNTIGSRPQTANGSSSSNKTWAVLKKVSIGHKAKTPRGGADEKNQHHPTAGPGVVQYDASGRSRSWSEPHGENNAGGSGDGDSGSHAKSKVRIVLKQLFGGKTKTTDSSGNGTTTGDRRVASMPAFADAAIIHQY